MDVREKLVELIAQKVCDTWSESCDEWLPHDCGKCYANDCLISEIADHLISNGVTVQEQDGCDYCQLFDDPCGVPMIAQEESESDRGIYLYNGFLCANGGEFCEARVNFCPMCGRKLLQQPKGE